MANILLVKLPNASLYKSKNLTILEPLGLEYIASAINRENHNVYLMDMDVVSENELFDCLNWSCLDFVGTTVSTPMVLEARKLVKKVKEADVETKVIIGGGHPTALPKNALNSTGADIAIIGEGENVINEILDNKLTAPIIAGIRINDLDVLSHPDRSLFPREAYKVSYSFGNKGLQKCASVITSRGCPFPCNYCASKTIHGNNVRFRSIFDIVSEIENLISYCEIQSILFLDDCFTLKEDRVIELCNTIIEKKLKFYWWLDTRVDCMSKSLLELMYKAGCRFIVYGVESGSQDVIDRIGKKIKIKDVEEVFKFTHEAGIDTKANFMLGHIDETEDEINESIALAKRLNATRYGFYLVLPLPGSPLYDIAVERDLITKSFDHFKWYDIPVSNISNVSSDKLMYLQRHAYNECKFKEK